MGILSQIEFRAVETYEELRSACSVARSSSNRIGDCIERLRGRAYYGADLVMVEIVAELASIAGDLRAVEVQP
jgi:hypothetical protein